MARTKGKIKQQDVGDAVADDVSRTQTEPDPLPIENQVKQPNVKKPRLLAISVCWSTFWGYLVGLTNVGLGKI